MKSNKSLQATLLSTEDTSTEASSINRSKPIIKTQYTKNATDYEKNSGISQTVPDDTMSMAEILKRFASGQPVNASSRTPYYDSENDFEEVPDLPKMDLSEQADYFEAHRNNLAALRNKFNFDKEEQRMAAVKEQLRKELKAELDEQQASFIPSKGEQPKA